MIENVKSDCSEHFPTTTEAPELTCPELIENVKSDCSENWPKEISPVNCREHFPTTTEVPELTCPELIENVKSDCSENWPKEISPVNCREHFPTTTEVPELTCPELIENVKSDCPENWPKEISPVNCREHFPTTTEAPLIDLSIPECTLNKRSQRLECLCPPCKPCDCKGKCKHNYAYYKKRKFKQQCPEHCDQCLVTRQITFKTVNSKFVSMTCEPCESCNDICERCQPLKPPKIIYDNKMCGCKNCPKTLPVVNCKCAI